MIPEPDFKHMAFGPDGRLWLVAGHDVRAFDLPGWRETIRFGNVGDDRQAETVLYAVAPGRAGVVVGRRDGRATWFDQTGDRLADWKLGDAPVATVALSANEHHAALADEAGRLRVVQLADHAVAFDLPTAHTDGISALAFATNGWLASGGRDRAIRLWAADGSPVMTLRLGGTVDMLKFSPDGRELYALVDGERALRRWRLDQLTKRIRALGIDPGYDVAGGPH
jgi:hypothetical protein